MTGKSSDRAGTHWEKRLAGTLDAFRSESYFLEWCLRVNKANTLGALLEHLGVTREEVIAVGDGVCDVTMLQLAGMGVAMGHSQDSVKVCADYVTASNEEDGVALAVEKLILAEVRAAEVPLDLLNERARHALMGNLGIQYTYASDERVESNHAGRLPYPPTLRHSAWRCHPCLGRNRCRARLHDYLRI